MTDKPKPYELPTLAPPVPETGPIYGVPLARRVQISGGLWQAMPTAEELKEAVEGGDERLVAAFEVLLNGVRQAGGFISDMKEALDVVEMIRDVDDDAVEIWQQFETTFPKLEA